MNVCAWGSVFIPRCHRIGPPGKISSPGASGLRKFTPPPEISFGLFPRTWGPPLGKKIQACDNGSCRIITPILSKEPVYKQAGIMASSIHLSEITTATLQHFRHCVSYYPPSPPTTRCAQCYQTPFRVRIGV